MPSCRLIMDCRLAHRHTCLRTQTCHSAICSKEYSRGAHRTATGAHTTAARAHTGVQLGRTHECSRCARQTLAAGGCGLTPFKTLTCVHGCPNPRRASLLLASCYLLMALLSSIMHMVPTMCDRSSLLDSLSPSMSQQSLNEVRMVLTSWRQCPNCPHQQSADGPHQLEAFILSKFGAKSGSRLSRFWMPASTWVLLIPTRLAACTCHMRGALAVVFVQQSRPAFVQQSEPAVVEQSIHQSGPAHAMRTVHRLLCLSSSQGLHLFSSQSLRLSSSLFNNQGLPIPCVRCIGHCVCLAVRACMAPYHFCPG